MRRSAVEAVLRPVRRVLLGQFGEAQSRWEGKRHTARLSRSSAEGSCVAARWSMGLPR